jgi:hypothetical protein
MLSRSRTEPPRISSSADGNQAAAGRVLPKEEPEVANFPAPTTQEESHAQIECPYDPDAAPSIYCPRAPHGRSARSLVPAGEQWWSLAFEDRGRDASRPPIRVLPSRLLETAVTLSSGRLRRRIHGQRRDHDLQWLNYLLLRKVLVRRDLGNFR